jgi:short-subunit dehydrogenase
MARRVLVTGAGSGLGRSIALAFVARGDEVFATVRDPERAQELTSETPGVTYLPMELTSESSRRELMETVGALDVLVNNAGYGIYGALEEVDDERAAAQFEVNVTAPLALTRGLLSGLRERAGIVIFIGSLGGRFALPFQAHYSATKAALAAASDALRMELKPLGVKVTCVEPGDFQTGFTDARDWGPSGVAAYAEASARCRKAVVNTERLHGGRPEEVAGLVVRLSHMKNPPARRPVGSWARTMVFAQRLLPDAIRELIVRKTYDQ